jgi:hypothetical protein
MFNVMQHFQTFIVLLNIWFFNTACNSFVDWYWSSVNRIGGVIISVLASSVVDRGFDLWLGQTEDYEICFYSFTAKHAVLRRKSKEW